MTKLRLGLIQSKSDEYDIVKNVEVGIKYVKEAKANGADIVLFPEAWITSYSFPEVLDDLPDLKVIEGESNFEQWRERAISDSSVYLEAFRNIAKELSIGIVITSLTKGTKLPKNSAFLIDRSGTVVFKYDKVHTCDFSLERYIEGGDGFHVGNFDDYSIGIMICYDREYPESARELMLQGAELVLVPNDCGSMEPRIQELSVRARENNFGIAMSNTPAENAGKSCAFSPIMWDDKGMPVDNTIIVADCCTDGVVYADFDMVQIRTNREKEDIGKYRKIKAYKHLTKD